MRDETRLIHVRRRGDEGFESLTVPVERASTVLFDSAEAFERRSTLVYDGYSYGLYGTPTARTLEDSLAGAEGAARAFVVPSGLAALTLVSLALARPGRRILVPDSLYGPARDMARRLLAAYGVRTDGYDPKGALGPALGDDVDLVWAESPGSATFEVQDVPALADEAHRAGALLAVNNTWATPLFFKPLRNGADISVQSLSKYAGGHSDVLMGSVAVKDLALFRQLKDVARWLGYGVGADDCALVLRGLSTQALRMRRSEATALQLLDWLPAQPSVRRVLHPSLPEHPGHGLWRRDFSGAAGLFSLVLEPAARPALPAAFEALRVLRIGAGWGGAHSLVAPSDPRSARACLDWLPDGPFVRVAVGLEHEDDLVEDLARFFEVIDRASGAAPADRAEADRQSTEV